jgi:hypothetical protein
MKKEKCIAVICRYNEDLEWSNQLEIPRVIYNKGDDISDKYWTINIENVGRESEAFLRFIVENYNDLPQRVVFLQGEPFYHYPGLLDFLKTPNKNDLCFLSNFNPICDSIGRPHHFEELPLQQILKELNLDDTQETFQFAAGAQYLVPRKYILSKSFLWWSNALTVHNNHKTGPWAFERLWPVIFNHKEK